MKLKKISLIVVLIFAAGAVALTFNQCNYDNETRVTINLQRNDLIGAAQPEIGIIERVLRFFSKPLYGGGWQPDNNLALTLSVKSPFFAEKTFSIPAGATTFSTTLPSVGDVTFTVIHIFDDVGATVVETNWGGQTTVNLAPGEQDISIKMIPMTYVTSATPATGTVYIYFRYPSVYTNSVTLYRYRSADIDAPHDIIYVSTSASNVSYTDTPPVLPGTYYYRVRVSSPLGEGVMSGSYGPVAAY